MNFEQLMPYDENGIKEMSKMATAIVREHYDPIIGKEQNDYMGAERVDMLSATMTRAFPSLRRKPRRSAWRS